MMRSIANFIFALLLFAAGTSAIATQPPAHTLVIARHDATRTSCQIVVPKDASAGDQFAAEELSKFIGQISGSTVPIINQATASSQGWTIQLHDETNMASEAYHILVKGSLRQIIITGGRPRGVLYGAYGLLHDYIGCRWYTPDITFTPPIGDVRIPSTINVSFNPTLEYRYTDWLEAEDPDWAARNRLNGTTTLDDKHGGHITFQPFVHSFNSILNPDELFATHPEYFSLVSGKRLGKNTQLCMSNPDVLKAAIAKAREWSKALNGSGVISVSQNDCENPCECPGCKALDEKYGNHSGSLIYFINEIAEAIEPEFPGITVDTLAYLHTRHPPTGIKPRHNVIVRLCSIEACFSHPLDRCSETSNVYFMNDLRGWNKLTKRLYVWDYTTDYNHFLMPFPNLDVLDINMRTFVTNGVVGVFEEGNQTGGGELAELRSWVLAQLMWNPKLQVDALIKEFVTHVYGPTAPIVQKFIDLQRSAIKTGGDHMRIFDAPHGAYLNDAVLQQCDALLVEAEKIAKDKGDAKLIERIARLRMPIWYTRFTLAREPPAVLKDQAHHIIETGHALKYTSIDAWTNGFDAYCLEKLNQYIQQH